jgi:hypothetical protein
VQQDSDVSSNILVFYSLHVVQRLDWEQFVTFLIGDFDIVSASVNHREDVEIVMGSSSYIAFRGFPIINSSVRIKRSLIPGSFTPHTKQIPIIKISSLARLLTFFPYPSFPFILIVVSTFSWGTASYFSNTMRAARLVILAGIAACLTDIEHKSSMRKNIDPIVFPRQYISHMHSFYGSDAITRDLPTTEELQKGCPSSENPNDLSVYCELLLSLDFGTSAAPEFLDLTDVLRGTNSLLC